MKKLSPQQHCSQWTYLMLPIWQSSMPQGTNRLWYWQILYFTAFAVLLLSNIQYIHYQIFNTYNIKAQWVNLGWVIHICISKITSIGSDNGLLPHQHQAIIWTNARILLIQPLGTNLSEILIEIHTFLFKKILLKIVSGKWRPFCPGLNVFKTSWFKTKHTKNYSGL